MSDPVVESLMLDLLEWISNPRERTYDEVMDAWRTSCPRLQVWEDASDRGLVTMEHVDGRRLPDAAEIVRGLPVSASRYSPRTEFVSFSVRVYFAAGPGSV